MNKPEASSVSVGGRSVDVSHLQPFGISLPGKGRENADLRVLVRFGLHVISCRPGQGQRADMRDEAGRPRAFCERRYAASLDLPSALRRMVLGKYPCWESKDNNRHLNYAVLDKAPGTFATLPDGEYHVVFFYLRPGNGSAADVVMHVVSAHHRRLALRRVKRRFDMHMVLRKCLFNAKRLP